LIESSLAIDIPFQEWFCRDRCPPSTRDG